MFKVGFYENLESWVGGGGVYLYPFENNFEIHTLFFQVYTYQFDNTHVKFMCSLQSTLHTKYTLSSWVTD